MPAPRGSAGDELAPAAAKRTAGRAKAAPKKPAKGA
jgi:hypothetical protein